MGNSSNSNVISLKRADFQPGPLSAFEVAWNIVKRSMDAVGGTSTVVSLHDFSYAEVAAVSILFGDAYFYVLHKEYGDLKSTWTQKAKQKGGVVFRKNIEGIGEYIESDNEEKLTKVMSFPHFKDGGFPAFQLEEQLRHLHEIIALHATPTDTRMGREYHVFECTSQDSAKCLSELMIPLAFIHGFRLKEGHVLVSDPGTPPAFMVSTEAYEAIKDRERGAMPRRNANERTQ